MTRASSTQVPSGRAVDSAALVGVFEVYELERLDYPEAYLIAGTDATSGRELISFHCRSTDRHRWDANRA